MKKIKFSYPALQLLGLCIFLWVSACNPGHDHNSDHEHSHESGETHDHGHDEDDTHAHDDDADGAHDHHEEEGHAHEGEEGHSDEVHLSLEQIQAIGLQTGPLQYIKTGGFIKANGVLDLPPDEYAAVTAPAAGYVKRTQGEYLIGSYVRRGTVLATLEHPDYIQMQQDYLEVLARLNYQQQEIERQRTLNEAEAGALKAYQSAEAEYKVLQARREGLRQKLRYLGLSVDQIEQGKILPTIALRAPISGYITALNIHRGKYIVPEHPVYEIVNNEHVHLELDVFEKDIARVRKGQRISFTVPSLGGEIFKGHVKLVGKSFDMENKTVRVHGHIEGKHPEFIRGLYLEAKIWTDEETVAALPEEAIVQEEGMYYIFVKMEATGNEVAFAKVPVRIGARDGKMVAITPLEALPENAEIVTGGTFYLYASQNKGEHDHNH